MSDNRNLGLGVMIGLLAGNEKSVEAFNYGVGKKITALSLGDDNRLHFVFEGGYKMCVYDDGQSCCETRYMHTNDKLEDFVGSVLQSATVQEAPNIPHEWGEHEVAFLVVTTSLGVFTCETHNEHNGYYGGFLVRAKPE